jgi:hypothetical protein
VKMLIGDLSAAANARNSNCPPQSLVLATLSQYSRNFSKKRNQ